MRALFLLLLCANLLYAAWAFHAQRSEPVAAPAVRVAPAYPQRLVLAGEYRPDEPAVDASPPDEPATVAEPTDRIGSAAEILVDPAPEDGTDLEAAEASLPGALLGDGSGPAAKTPPSATALVDVPEDQGAVPEEQDETAMPALPRCVAIGPFQSEQAAREALGRLGGRLAEGAVVPAAERVDSSFWVHVEPRATEAEARVLAAELAERGIESFVIRDEPALRNALSLGVFQDRASAEKYALRFAHIGYPIAIHEARRTRQSFELRGTTAGQDADLLESLGPGLAVETLDCDAAPQE